MSVWEKSIRLCERKCEIFNYTEKDQGSIEIYEPSGTYKIEISSSRPQAVWKVKFKGHPRPTLVWYDNFGREITKLSSSDKTDKYETNTTHDYTILKIRFLELKDSGFYTLKAFNGLLSTEKKFELVVKGWSRKQFFGNKYLKILPFACRTTVGEGRQFIRTEGRNG